MMSREKCDAVRGLRVCLFVLLLPVTLSAEVGKWRNFTSMKDVKGIARLGSTYWAATSGGLFAWKDGATTFEQFTNAEGLQSIDLTAVAVDRNGNVWSGTSTGVIHIYSTESTSWRYILDIASANQTNKGINSFAMHGDTVLLCTEFGLSVFLSTKFQFADTYTKFGSLPQNARISVFSAAIHQGKIWAAVSDRLANHRVAVADLSNPNLLPPEAWSLQTVGTTSTVPKVITVFNNRLYCGTSRGLFYLDDSTWVSVDSLAGKNIVSLHASPTLLAACDAGGSIYTLNASNVTARFGTVLPHSPTSVLLGPSGSPVVGAFTGGILTFNGSWNSHVPNGPNANQFISVTVDPQGNVWSASGNSNASGFYRYDGKEWKSFTRSNSPLPTNDYYRISVGCDGSAWASSWGRGVLEIPAGSETISPTNIYGRNVGMEGLASDSNFVVVTDVTCDSRGNHWISINQARDTRIFAVRKTDGTWNTLPARIGSSRIATLFNNVAGDRMLAVDAFDNLWAAVREGTFKGVISFGNRGTVSDSVRLHLSAADGLPSNEITTIVVDHDNDIWVGTDRGIGIILDPSNPKRSGGIASYRPLNGLLINTIAVDPLNQKWVGTNEGAILLSKDGTQQLASYTVQNTGGRLIDNDIKSIAVDPKTGTVYFGTLNGLASLTTTAAAPKPTFEGLSIYPNPYRVPNGVPLTVDGLVQNSSLKILAIDGRLIRNLRTPGGRIGFWDGKDENGTTVSTGVYIIVAYSENGNEVSKNKVAVIRR